MFGVLMLVFVIVYCFEFVGCSFYVCGVLLVIYFNNFYILISYVNVWFFIVEKEGEELIWWFGGGFDLIFYYFVFEDV